jgi:cytochrome c oxidase subunit 2
MNVDLYERIWMWGVGVMLRAFLEARPPLPSASDPSAQPRRNHRPQDVLWAIRASSRKASRVDAQNHIHARVVGLMFSWLPVELTVPADTPITFHLTSVDVTHGFEIVRTNGQAMVVPGYISQFTTQFAPGEYLIACNEYCGIGHHTMAGKLHVVPRAQWKAPMMTASLSGGAHEH